MVVHGLFDDGPCRAPLVPDLAGEYDVVAVDAHGHDRSDAPETGYDAGTRADDLASLVGALGLKDPILFGHSMGGDTVAAAAPCYPDLSRTVILEDPAAMLEHGEDDWEESIAGARDRLELWENHTKAELLTTNSAGTSRPAGTNSPPGSRTPTAGCTRRSSRCSRTTPSRPRTPIPRSMPRRWSSGRTPTGRDASATGSWSMACRTVARPRPDAGHCVFRDSRERATGKLHSFLDDV